MRRVGNNARVLLRLTAFSLAGLALVLLGGCAGSQQQSKTQARVERTDQSHAESSNQTAYAGWIDAFDP
jgi:outer membrane biogenesis lipoprotein LolB